MTRDLRRAAETGQSRAKHLSALARHQSGVPAPLKQQRSAEQLAINAALFPVASTDCNTELQDAANCYRCGQ